MFGDELLETLAEEAAEERFAPGNLLRYLRQCLERLSNRDQQLIQKRYEPGMTVARLAEEIGRTANSLSKSLGRIRRTLLECIERKQAAAGESKNEARTRTDITDVIASMAADNFNRWRIRRTRPG